MEREDMKGKIVLTVVGAATLLVALAGATFAYFSATSTSETRQITTSNLNLTVSAVENSATHVTNIKPTNWTSTDSAKTNEDIAIIPFSVTGTSSTSGTYTINMKTTIDLTETQLAPDGTTTVTLEGGSESDIKYRLYKADGTPVGDDTAKSFAATTDVDIVTDGVIEADKELNDEYVLYVYIQNDKANPQNKLQEVDFTITLGGSAVQAAQ